MTFFFLVVGLEAKRELDTGELRERQPLAIPVVAAVGGMACRSRSSWPSTPAAPGRTAGGRRCRPTPRSRSGVLALVAPGGTRLRASPAHAGGGRRPRGAGGDRHRLHGGRLSWLPLAVAVGLFGLLLALRYAPIALAPAGRGGRSASRSGSRCRVGDRPGDRRARGRARHERLSAGARRAGAGDRARAVVPRAADARARPLRAARAWRPRSRRTSGSSTGFTPGRAS